METAIEYSDLNLKKFQQAIKKLNADKLSDFLQEFLNGINFNDVQEKPGTHFNNFQKMILLAEALKKKDSTSFPPGSPLQTAFKQKMQEFGKTIETDIQYRESEKKEKRKAFQVIYNNINTVLFGGKPSVQNRKEFALYKDRILNSQDRNALLNDPFIKRQTILSKNPYADSFQTELEQFNHPSLPMPGELALLMQSAQQIINTPKEKSDEAIKDWQKQAKELLNTYREANLNTGPGMINLIQEAQKAVSAVVDRKKEFKERLNALQTDIIQKGQIPKDLFIEGQTSLSVQTLLGSIPKADVVAFFKALIEKLSPQKLQALLQKEGYRDFPPFLETALQELMKTPQNNLNDNIVTNILVTFNMLAQDKGRLFRTRTTFKAEVGPKVAALIEAHIEKAYPWIYCSAKKSIKQDIQEFLAGENRAFLDSLVNKGSMEKFLEKYQPKNAAAWLPWQGDLMEILEAINSGQQDYCVFRAFKTIVLLAQAIKEHAPKLMEDQDIQTSFRQAIVRIENAIDAKSATRNDKRIFHALCNNIDTVLFEKPSALHRKNFTLYRECIKNSNIITSLLERLNKEPVKQSLLSESAHTDSFHQKYTTFMGNGDGFKESGKKLANGSKTYSKYEGSLDKLYHQKQTLSRDQFLPIFKQIAYTTIKGLKALEDTKASHCDIKLETITMVNKSGLYSATFTKPQQGSDGLPIITPGYSLDPKKSGESGYWKKHDRYSLLITLLLLYLPNGEAAKNLADSVKAYDGDQSENKRIERNQAVFEALDSIQDEEIKALFECFKKLGGEQTLQNALNQPCFNGIKLMEAAEEIIKAPEEVSITAFQKWQGEAKQLLAKNKDPNSIKLIREAEKAISYALTQPQRMDQFGTYLDLLQDHIFRHKLVPKELVSEQRHISIHELLSNVTREKAINFFKALITTLEPKTLQALFQEKAYHADLSLLNKALNEVVKDVVKDKGVTDPDANINDQLTTNILVTVKALQKYAPKQFTEATKEGTYNLVQKSFDAGFNDATILLSKGNKAELSCKGEAKLDNEAMFLRSNGNKTKSSCKEGKDKLERELIRFFQGKHPSFVDKLMNKGSIVEFCNSYKKTASPLSLFFDRFKGSAPKASQAHDRDNDYAYRGERSNKGSFKKVSMTEAGDKGWGPFGKEPPRDPGEGFNKVKVLKNC